MATTPTAEDWQPASCTLPTVRQPLRLAEFDEFFGAAVRRSTRISTTPLDLVISPESEATGRDLAQRESSCCSFFRFEFDHAHNDLVMRIGVPQDRVDVLDGLQARMMAVVGAKTVNVDD
jgi:hypothetical protein